MGKYVQIGTAALRSTEGEFLQDEPIFRELKKRSRKAAGQSYFDADVLGDIFASKCSNYLKEKKIRERGLDISRNRRGRISDPVGGDGMGNRSMSLCTEEEKAKEEI